VTLFDIDHFKLYNDHYGHLAGDEALRQVALCFKTAVRAGERAYRYGGEEFLLLLPDCTAESARLAAERIGRTVASAVIAHDARPTLPPVVTISGGVTCWTPGNPSSISDLLQRADEALFAAKSAGRNRVHVAPAFPENESAPVSVLSRPIESGS